MCERSVYTRVYVCVFMYMYVGGYALISIYMNICVCMLMRMPRHHIYLQEYMIYTRIYAYVTVWIFVCV